MPHHVAGAASRVSIIPATSSHTMAEWSCTPSFRALSPQIQIPATVTTIVTARANQKPKGATASPNSRPTIEPNVPGATGASPEPNPSASRWTGSRSNAAGTGMRSRL